RTCSNFLIETSAKRTAKINAKKVVQYSSLQLFWGNPLFLPLGGDGPTRNRSASELFILKMDTLGMIPLNLLRNRTKAEATFWGASQNRGMGHPTPNNLARKQSMGIDLYALRRPGKNPPSISLTWARCGMNNFFGEIGRDLRFALRGLNKDRKFTLMAVLALALGIGSVTVIFSAIYGVVIDTFPY